MGYVTRPHGFTVAASPSAACALPLSQMCSAQALPFAALRLCCCGFAIAARDSPSVLMLFPSQQWTCTSTLLSALVLHPHGFAVAGALPPAAHAVPLLDGLLNKSSLGLLDGVLLELLDG